MPKRIAVLALALTGGTAGTGFAEQIPVAADILAASAANTTSCAAGFVIGPETTPGPNSLLRRARSDRAAAPRRASHLTPCQTAMRRGTRRAAPELMETQ